MRRQGQGQGLDESPAGVDADKTADDAARRDESRPGKGINQAGYLKDKDAPGTDGEGDRHQD